MPESDTHDASIEYVRAVLLAWAERQRRSIKLARNLGIRWVEDEERAGFDPDLCLIEPPPPSSDALSSLQLWLPDHHVPRLAVEIVSPSHPYKDYVDTPQRAAAAGIGELWVYDPMLVGPKARGGPLLLQIWGHGSSGRYERKHAGVGPAYSEVLRAWLHPVASRVPHHARLRISDRPSGGPFWPTLVELQQRLLQDRDRRLERERRRADDEQRRAQEEQRRAQEEQRRAQEERRRADDERSAREQAEARIRQLEAELAKARGS